MYNYGYDKEKWCCINIDTGVLINLGVRIAAEGTICGHEEVGIYDMRERLVRIESGLESLIKAKKL